MLLLAACAGGDSAGRGVGRAIGPAYQINGVWYEPRQQPGYDATGIASWYGPGFHGRRTASGKTYDMEAMTAAHTTLPLGSRVRVTNLRTSRAIELTINDRGPFVAGRIIDVSRAAARELGFLRAGIARVRVQLLDAPTLATTGSAPARRAAPDRTLFQNELDIALERGSRGMPYPWGDPERGAHGVIVPLTSPAQQSSPLCRNYKRTAILGNSSAVYMGRACRRPEGAWRILREKPAPGLPAT